MNLLTKFQNCSLTVFCIINIYPFTIYVSLSTIPVSCLQVTIAITTTTITTWKSRSDQWRMICDANSKCALINLHNMYSCCCYFFFTWGPLQSPIEHNLITISLFQSIERVSKYLTWSAWISCFPHTLLIHLLRWIDDDRIKNLQECY